MKQIEPPVLALHPKDVAREKIAEDIRKYVNRGGTIKTIHHGDTALDGNLNKTWGKTLRNDPPKKG